MWGFLGDIKQFFAQVVALGWWIGFGAGLAFLGALFRGWLGYAGVAIGGAVLMFLAVSGNWLSDDSSKIDRLEAQLEAKKAELAIEQATNDQLTKDLALEAEAAEANAEVTANLQRQIDAMEDRPECGVSKEFIDELKKLR